MDEERCPLNRAGDGNVGPVRQACSALAALP